MQPDLSPMPQNAQEQALMERFRTVAQGLQGLFEYPTGRAGMEALAYPPQALAAMPGDVLDWYCGVGNVFAPGLPSAGWRVLDVGCGAGVDALVAAHYVGAGGRVDGVELSPDMLCRARANTMTAGCANVHLQTARAERLPFEDATFDLLISNGVYNLIVDKTAALAEALRVLKPGGRMQIADQILETEAPAACALFLGDPVAQAQSLAR